MSGPNSCGLRIKRTDPLIAARIPNSKFDIVFKSSSLAIKLLSPYSCLLIELHVLVFI